MLSYILLRVPGALAVVLGLPMFALAFLRPDGLAAEVFIRNWLKARVMRPRVRYNVPENDLYQFLWHGRLLGRTVRKAGKGGRDKTESQRTGRPWS